MALSKPVVALLLLLGLLGASITSVVVADEAVDAEEFVDADVENDNDDLEVEPAEDHSVHYSPANSDGFFFLETFQGEDAIKAGRVVKSSDSKYSGQVVAVENPYLRAGIAGDKGLIVKQAAKHYGVGLPFASQFTTDEGDFVLQYEVRLQDGLECGGAYLKVLAAEPEPSFEDMTNDTPYIVMFGPDKCGATNKVHFILRHENPVTHEWSEHHLASPPTIESDKLSHLYTLIIRSDNTFEIKIDNKSKKTGVLGDDLEPPINPDEEIDDPEDEKPDDWVDEEKIPDPTASKPDDWDEDAPATIPDMDAVKPEGWLDDAPEYVPDPEAEMPEDWDEEEDGEYEAPLVPNPACEEAPGCGEWVRPNKANPEYKGKWSAPMIDNPDYVGPWAPRKIPNPGYFVDESPADLRPMAGVAIEIWTMQGQMLFDNILVGRDEAAAAKFAEGSWAVKYAEQKAFDERQAARLKRRAREQAYKTGGFVDKLNYFMLEGVDLATENPIPAAVTVVVVFASMIFLCCRSGPEPPRRPARPVYREAKQGESDSENEDGAGADAADVADAADEGASSDESDPETAPEDEAEAEAEAENEPEEAAFEDAPSDDGEEEEAPAAAAAEATTPRTRRRRGRGKAPRSGD